MVCVPFRFLFITIFGFGLINFSEEEVQPSISKRDGVDDNFEKAVSVLKQYFSREIIQSDSQEISEDNSQGILEQKFPEAGQKSQKSQKLNSGSNIVRRTLEADLNVPHNEDHTKDYKRNHETKRYLNEWVVHMSGGEESARRVVKELGYNFHGPVKGFEEMYRVSHRMSHHIHKRETEAITRHINSHIEVLWAEQQVSRPRDKRSITQDKKDKKDKDKKDKKDKSKRDNKDKKNAVKRGNQLYKRDQGTPKPIDGNQTESKSQRWIKYLRSQENKFNDPLWKHQWYLFDTRTNADLPELDLKVITVWNSGITGKGIKVVIIDDGLEWNHTDLVDSYDPALSYDMNDDDFDPTPRYDSARTNAHGTKCAGEIVMKPNNNKCGVGVAYGASIGGIRMLDGDVSDSTEGASLAIGLDKVDIVSCSWGPTDDGTRVEGPGRLAQMALEKGVNEGRKGKGIIFIWAAGNGGLANDNCNCDGYVSSIYTISVSTASEAGESPWYSEHCSSTLTSAYSSGAYSDQKISTVDIENDCTISFTGTSASAPLAAGIIALALEANPSMGWRDIQHAVVRSSDWTPLSRDAGWQTNGAGLHFNRKFGYGLLLAEPMVNAARNWTAVPDKRICTTKANISTEVTIASGGSYKIEVTPLCNSTNEIKYLEHVQILLYLKHSMRGTLRIFLISPQGTNTTLLTPRPSDISTEGFCDWPFTTVHMWGEDPKGTWKLNIEDTSKSGQNGIIVSVSIILHGTKEPVI